MKKELPEAELEKLQSLQDAGTSLLASGQAEAAVAAFEDALKIDKISSRCWMGLGLARSQGKDSEVPDPALGRAAECAIVEGDPNLLEQLLDLGVPVSHEDSQGWPLLLRAAWKNQVGIIELLLQRGADVDHIGTVKETALIVATVDGYEDVLRVLLSRGASVNMATEDGLTALIVAATEGWAGIIRLLLENGAKVDARDVRGTTGLMIAARRVPSRHPGHGVRRSGRCSPDGPTVSVSGRLDAGSAPLPRPSCPPGPKR